MLNTFFWRAMPIFLRADLNCDQRPIITRTANLMHVGKLIGRDKKRMVRRLAESLSFIISFARLFDRNEKEKEKNEEFYK